MLQIKHIIKSLEIPKMFSSITISATLFSKLNFVLKSVVELTVSNT